MSEAFKEIKVLQLIMGRQCNVRCAMCYQRTFDSAGDNMSSVVYKESLLPLYPYLSRMIIMGGEPTVMPNCRELVEFIGRFPNIRLILFTNGVYIDEFWMRTFMERSEVVRFSINAATRKTYDRIVKYGDFDRVIGNIKQITKRRTDQKPLVQISTVLLRRNVHEMADFIDLGHELGADSVKFCMDPALSFYKVSAKDLHKELDKANRAIDRTGMVVQGLNAIARHVNYSRSENRVNCRVDTCRLSFAKLIMVDYLGDVRVCSFTWRVLGNIYKSSLKEVLENWQLARLQQMTASGDYSWCLPYCPDNPAPRQIAMFSKYFYLLRRNPAEFLMEAVHRLGRRRHL